MGMIRRPILRRGSSSSSRGVPRSADSDGLSKKPKTATFATIILDLNLFDRGFWRHPQLASSGAVLGVPLGSREELLMRFYFTLGHFGSKEPNVYAHHQTPKKVLRETGYICNLGISAKISALGVVHTHSRDIHFNGVDTLP